MSFEFEDSICSIETSDNTDVANSMTFKVPSPNDLKSVLSLPLDLEHSIQRFRSVIADILSFRDQRWLMIVGPCSIHDPKAALEYAHNLKRLSEEVADEIFIVMRVYCDKPRSILGWKGIKNDPDMCGGCNISKGLEITRRLMLDIASIGVPIACEFLDCFSQFYYGDLPAWVAIGARTSESQVHREIASSFDVAVGFKNDTSGDVVGAVNSVVSSRSSHSFLSIDSDGKVLGRLSRGNPHTHLVLRGGKGGPNYDKQTMEKVRDLRDLHSIHFAVIVDCSHDNSNKRYELQPLVAKKVIEQYLGCSRHAFVKGLMIESNLSSGKQPLETGGKLAYGVSVTDGCLGFEETAALIREISLALKRKIHV
jgi:3-deoxy-7-phosphoheptulonate synthase